MNGSRSVNWSWTTPLLLPLSGLYGLGVAWNRRVQKRRQQRLPVPVFSIGNITTGGTGKTEAVMMLAWLLRSLGLAPAVLSRGYGRRSTEPVLVVSDGEKLQVGVQDAGDEPFLLASRLNGIPVLVGADRYAAGRRAIERFNSNAFVLDDGFQRRDQLDRDLDIVLVDATDPFGRGHLLPAGRLREPLSALREADALIITRSDQHSTAGVIERLQKLAPRVPIFTAKHAPAGLVSLVDSTRQPAGSVRGRRWLAVAGIARPQAFTQTLTGLGAEVVGTLAFPDHHWYSEADRRRILQHGHDLKAEVITTSKDAVRLHWPPSAGPAWALEVQFKVLTPAEGLLPLVERALHLGPADPQRT